MQSLSFLNTKFIGGILLQSTSFTEVQTDFGNFM